ncbi:diguanylate cyclase domain-containing protein [Massilia sp. YIM B02443]|uniref:diguanylate cyclase domain-containing protein n=1 Tax=Massilia sp. YIM B02443 TaxID=3050127 RepID=UPI0025B63B43|nr:diguanylate cyclase [Massilia sp. YIM B02443]MDN4038435.1 diguanylate cyclase [Massilia sp. YIM B02443]
MMHPALALAAPSRQSAILIVDDAPDSLGLLQDIMREQGYQTFVATSGKRALDIATRVQPDLILLDVILPDLDGLEICRRLKRQPDTAHIPVIFVSSCGETDDIVAGFDTGAADYIAKPVRLAEVCVRVRAQLRQRSSAESQKQQAERLQSIVDGMDEGLMLVGGDGRVAYANPACERFLDGPATGLAGRPLAELLAAPASQDYAAYFANPDDLDAAKRCRGTREVLLPQGDGSVHAMDLSLSPMAGGEALFVALLHDITHHKQSETALQRAALVDPLTRIANRRHFDAFMDKEWARAIRSGQPLSLIVCDVDHFKGYNDSLGHAAGDACLQAIAEALQSHAMRPTDLAARYGGEEFVILLADTAEDAAARLGEAARAHVERLAIPNPRAATSGVVTVSVGVASIVPTLFDDVRSFFVAADRAMYEAKARGRNRVVTVQAGTPWDGGRGVQPH